MTVRDGLAEIGAARSAIAAYRSAVRCGESETETLRAQGDEGLLALDTLAVMFAELQQQHAVLEATLQLAAREYGLSSDGLSSGLGGNDA